MRNNMSWRETLLIRDCINYAIEEPPYEYEDYEIENLKFYQEKYEKLVNEFIGFAGAMDILIKSGQKKGDQIIQVLKDGE